MESHVGLICISLLTNDLSIFHLLINSLHIMFGEVSNMLLEISGEITPERMKGWSQSKNNTQLCM